MLKKVSECLSVNLIKEFTRLCSLQMERGLLLIRERCSLALESRSHAVQVKVVAAVVQRGRFTVHISPVRAGLCLLIKGRAVRTQEPEVLDAHAGHLYAHVEHLTLRLCVRIISAQDLVPACEFSGRHFVQTICGVVEGS